MTEAEQQYDRALRRYLAAAHFAEASAPLTPRDVESVTGKYGDDEGQRKVERMEAVRNRRLRAQDDAERFRAAAQGRVERERGAPLSDHERWAGFGNRECRWWLRDPTKPCVTCCVPAVRR